MSHVICPGCGATYASEAVAHVAKFKCAGCGGVLAGGRTEAAAPAAPAAQSPRAAAPARPVAHAARPSAGRPARPAAAKKGGVPPAVWIGGGVAAVAIVGAVIAMSGKSSPAPAPETPSVPAEAAKPDPMKDVAAWKALAAPERETLAERYAAGADVTSTAAAQRAAEFLTARGETASVAALAARVLQRDAANTWARTTLGHADVAAEVDACLAKSEQADEANDAKFLALKAARQAHPAAPWWADAAETRRIRDLVAEVEKAEARFNDPYEAGVEQWIRRQRAVDIMRDYPALHASVGPYVIFVSLNVPKDAKGQELKDATLAQISKEELGRAQAILDRSKRVFSAFYDAWMNEVGPHFGFTRYGPENADFKTLMKANVFAKAEDFFAYNVKSEAGVGGFTRAYYSPMEPRFITTYDGGGSEDTTYTDQVQCHEATHQLVHFYTWDLTRKDLGRDPDWLEVAYRPLWSGEGFAEFFSSHKVVDGKYVWMQPLDERMQQIWIFEEMVKEKGWIPWRLKEFFFTLHHGGQLNALSSSRAKTNADEWIAEGVMGNLFYAKAWSFVYFLWYAEAGGAPKYRDRYIEYLKSEFHVRFAKDAKTGEMEPRPAGSAELMRLLGVTTDAQLEALEKEWNEFTGKLVAANHKPDWDVERAKSRTMFGFDKPAEKKADKPKK